MMAHNLYQTYLLFAIFAGVLLIASSIGFVLKQRAGTQASL